MILLTLIYDCLCKHMQIITLYKSIYIKYVYNKDFQNIEFIIVNKQIELKSLTKWKK